MDRLTYETRSSRVEGRTLYGTVHKFGTRARIKNTYEEFSPDAFNEVLSRAETDIVAFWNHDRNQILGRQSNGSLRLELDEEELRFELDLPETSYANDVRALAEQGLIGGTSFGFLPGKVRMGTAPDGLMVRHHLSVRDLIEVSPVTLPAYSNTSVSVRGQEYEVESLGSQLARARARVRGY